MKRDELSMGIPNFIVKYDDKIARFACIISLGLWFGCIVTLALLR